MSIFSAPNRVFIAVCLAALLGGCATNIKLKNFDLDELVHDIEKKAYVIQAFRAQFVKTRHSAVFNRDLTITGVLVFRKPNIFRLLVTGDINVEIISDGKKIVLIHDGLDHERYELQGDRDLSRFADPLVLLLNQMGNGALRKFAVKTRGTEGDTKRIEIDPQDATNFERVDRAFVWYGNSGQVEKVKLVFKDGDWDETQFQSWALLPSNAPEIIQLKRRLMDLSAMTGPRASGTRAYTITDRSHIHDPAWKRPYREDWGNPSLSGRSVTAAEIGPRPVDRSGITSP
jgi:outer membrane lipoprotein-sorting protein